MLRRCFLTSNKSTGLYFLLNVIQNKTQPKMTGEIKGPVYNNTLVAVMEKYSRL